MKGRAGFTEKTQDIISRNRKLLFDTITEISYRFLNHQEHKLKRREWGVNCDCDSGYHYQLEINTFTFIFVSLRTTEFILRYWKRWFTINPHSLVLMNLNQVLSSQSELPKSFGDYFKRSVS